MNKKSKMKLTIDHTKVDGEDLIDFVVWLDLASNELRGGTQVTFIGGEGEMVLAHELESYDLGTGTLKTWVPVPKVSCSSDTVIYVRTDSGAEAETRPGAGLWGHQYKLVHVGGRLIHESRNVELTNELTVEAWVKAVEPHAEVTQTLVAQWAVQEQCGSFAAYDAGKTAMARRCGSTRTAISRTQPTGKVTMLLPPMD